MQRDSTEALEHLHRRLERRQLREPHDLAIQVIPALKLVEEERVILAEHESIRGRERRLLRREMLEPLEVRRAPVRALAEDEPAAGEELENVVTRLQDLTLERLAATDD